MNVYEMDWRISSTNRVLETLSQGIEEAIADVEQFENPTEWNVAPFDGLDAMEQIEDLLGIGFVTVQTYITGTVADVRKLVNSELSKQELIRTYDDFTPGMTFKRLELCDAVANYWKHHEEWKVWSPSNQNVSILFAAGIRESDEFPCDKAINLLCPGHECGLRLLGDILSGWRERIIASLRKAS